MEELSDEDGRTPMSILITYDGQLSVEDDDPITSFLPFQESLSETTTNENSIEDLEVFQKSSNDSNGTLNFVNVSVNSDVLDSYMELLPCYQCKKCPYVSNDKKDSYQHSLEHLLKENPIEEQNVNSKVVFLCSTCSKACSTAEEIKMHMIKDHKLRNNASDDDNTSEYVKTINVSIETTDEKAPRRKRRKPDEIIQNLDTNLNYVCSKRHCTYKFSTEHLLKIHEKCHIASDVEPDSCKKLLFQCLRCNMLFNDWQACSAHLYKVHELDCDLLKCPVCETYRTPVPLRLENHMRIHSDVRAFTCKQCGRTFKQASQLRNHAVAHAPKDSTGKPSWSTSKQCNICFKMYSDSKSLKKHREEVHSKLRPFVCNVCGHASARKAMLKMHQRQHTGQKPHSCHMCSFRTADHNSLRKHIMRHTGVRPYKCPYCSYTAIQSGSFKNHMKLMHANMGGVFVCHICLFKTISEDNHVRHISDHLTGLIPDEAEAKDDVSVSKVSAEGRPGAELTAAMFGRSLGAAGDGRGDAPRPMPAPQEEDVVDTGGITIPADALESHQ